MMNKAELRQEIRKRKSMASPSDLIEQSANIMMQLEEEQHFQQAPIILLYYSLPDEVCTHSFIEKWYRKKRILLPKVEGSNLTLHLYEGNNSMKEGAYHIMEPITPAFTDIQDMSLIVMPGMAFDKQGNRLGRGKGFYDRLLAKFREASTYKVGLAFRFQMVEHVPTENTDIPVDKVLYNL